MATFALLETVDQILVLRGQSLAADRSEASSLDYTQTHLPSSQLQFLHLQQINHNHALLDIALLRQNPRAAISTSLPRQHQSRRSSLLPRDVAPCSGPPRQTLQLERMRISPRASMNARYAPTKSLVIQRFGLVRHVGQSSISVASKNGPGTKGRVYINPARMGCSLNKSNGDALVATCQKTYCHRHTRVGARRSWIPRVLVDFHPIHVVKHVAKSARFPRSAPTDAIYLVMLDHALRVRRWGLFNPASAGRHPPRENVLRLITRKAGAVANHATICWLALMRVPALAMKACVAPAKSR